VAHMHSGAPYIRYDLTRGGATAAADGTSAQRRVLPPNQTKKIHELTSCSNNTNYVVIPVLSLTRRQIMLALQHGIIGGADP
jgi:hypothetical protein